jgi:hypothetical protein
MAEKVEMTPSDAAYLLDALRSVTSPVIVSTTAHHPPPSHSPFFQRTRLTRSQINVGEIAAQKNAKVNTVQKRLSEIKKRYNLNLHTTAVTGAGPATPTKPKPARIAKTPTPKKTGGKDVKASKAAAIAERLEELERSADTAVVKREDD